MTEKLCGALLLTLSGFLAGFAVRRELNARARILSALAEALARMRTEITLRLLPLPDLMASEAAGPDAPSRAFFESLCRRYAETASFEDAWAAALDSLALPEAAEPLSGLGRVLGQCDAESQGRALDYARTRLLEAAEDAREAAKVRGSLALRLLPGIAAMLAILLW